MARCQATLYVAIFTFTFILPVTPTCPNGEAADKILLYFRPEDPRGIPGLDLEEPTVVAPSLSFGPVTILEPQVYGLSDMILHSFSINAHAYNGTLRITLPSLEIRARYQIPGLWWTTEGDLTVTLSDVHAYTTLELAVLDDSCFYVLDYKSDVTTGNVSYSTNGSEDGEGMLGLFFDDFVEGLFNMTKPMVLRELNQLVRYTFTSFLPNDQINIHNYMFMPRPVFNASAYDTPPRIPSKGEQYRALVRLVKYQIPWMFGQPLLLPGTKLNIMEIAELHNMSVHHLERVTDIQHLSMEFDGEIFTFVTRMYHRDVYNRHRVLWFPSTLFKFWQWTETSLGLVKHKAVVKLHRKMFNPPLLTDFMIRPVVFNPESASEAERIFSRMSRRLMDAMRTDFGDAITALLYTPLQQRANAYLNSVNPRQLIKDFVCAGT